jgi:2-dehydropantoate 2-reductase
LAAAEPIARKLGVHMRISIERRIAGAERVGAHKTSMLQDVEQGRPMELEALVGAVVELGVLTETPTPTIGAVYACAGLLARTLQAHGARLSI